MKEIIAKLKTLLPASEFIVTGSYVLAQYGLMSKESVHDIDIILIKPDATAIMNMVNFQAAYPARTTPKDGSQLKAIFIYDNVKVDVFVLDVFAEDTLLIDGIRHTTIPHILAEKRKAGRMKDWLQCREMARLLFVPEAFEAMLNTTWRHSFNSDY